MKSWESTHFSTITVHFTDGRPAEGFTDCDKIWIEDGVLQFDEYAREHAEDDADNEDVGTLRGYSLANILSYEVTRGAPKPSPREQLTREREHPGVA